MEIEVPTILEYSGLSFRKASEDYCTSKVNSKRRLLQDSVKPLEKFTQGKIRYPWFVTFLKPDRNLSACPRSSSPVKMRKTFIAGEDVLYVGSNGIRELTIILKVHLVDDLFPFHSMAGRNGLMKHILPCSPSGARVKSSSSLHDESAAPNTPLHLIASRFRHIPLQALPWNDQPVWVVILLPHRSVHQIQRLAIMAMLACQRIQQVRELRSKTSLCRDQSRLLTGPRVQTIPEVSFLLAVDIPQDGVSDAPKQLTSFSRQPSLKRRSSMNAAVPSFVSPGRKPSSLQARRRSENVTMTESPSSMFVKANNLRRSCIHGTVVEIDDR